MYLLWKQGHYFVCPNKNTVTTHPHTTAAMGKVIPGPVIKACCVRNETSGLVDTKFIDKGLVVAP
jgi:hypothetical protein